VSQRHLLLFSSSSTCLIFFFSAPASLQLHDLPDYYYHTLKYLVGHLKKVADHCDQNKVPGPPDQPLVAYYLRIENAEGYVLIAVYLFIYLFLCVLFA